MKTLSRYWHKTVIAPAVLAVGLSGCSSLGPNVPPDAIRDNFLAAGEDQSRILTGEEARKALNSKDGTEWPLEKESAVQVSGYGTYRGGLPGYLAFTRDYTKENNIPFKQYPACQHFISAVNQIDAKISGAAAGAGVFAIVGSVLAGRGGAVAGGLFGGVLGAYVNDMLNKGKLRQLNADCQSRLASNDVLGGSVVARNVEARVRGIYKRIPQ